MSDPDPALAPEPAKPVGEPPPPPPPTPRTLSWPTLTTAGFLLAAFLWFTYQMFVVRVGASDAEWARSLTIYGSIESFALAAAGVLLGTQIQAGRVRAAEERAERKTLEAEQQKKEAEKAKSELGGYRRVTRELRRTLNAPPQEAVFEHAEKDARIRHARSLLDEFA